MEDCVFCKIASGKIPSIKIWENEGFVAILDINAAVKGQTLVIPKKHMTSNFYENSDEDIGKIMNATKTVAKILEKGLETDRIITVVEGLEIDHLHIKLYPHFGEMHDGYPGYKFIGGAEKTTEELELAKEEILGEKE